MCGFAGFVGKVEDRETVLVNMMDTIIHRGPDSAGKYVDEDAALGFRRLSIIDLSSVGDQPLIMKIKTWCLFSNGESTITIRNCEKKLYRGWTMYLSLIQIRKRTDTRI